MPCWLMQGQPGLALQVKTGQLTPTLPDKCDGGAMVFMLPSFLILQVLRENYDISTP